MKLVPTARTKGGGAAGDRASGRFGGPAVDPEPATDAQHPEEEDAEKRGTLGLASIDAHMMIEGAVSSGIAVPGALSSRPRSVGL